MTQEPSEHMEATLKPASSLKSMWSFTRSSLPIYLRFVLFLKPLIFSLQKQKEEEACFQNYKQEKYTKWNS